mmetsp:Transcript_11566/g.21065  ORF Transcript_11566/g.21065 Transcript_11566/m.21065 type:complete len:105 (+) Transcript_11566:879-1193(+)
MTTKKVTHVRRLISFNGEDETTLSTSIRNQSFLGSYMNRCTLCIWVKSQAINFSHGPSPAFGLDIICLTGLTSAAKSSTDGNYGPYTGPEKSGFTQRSLDRLRW